MSKEPDTKRVFRVPTTAEVQAYEKLRDACQLLYECRQAIPGDQRIGDAWGTTYRALQSLTRKDADNG